MIGIDHNFLRLVATDVRFFLEDQWPIWHHRRGRSQPMPLSRGTCQTSSLFLSEALRDHNLNGVVRQGNSPGKAEGFLHKGSWIGHAWVEISGFVVDITGDQFDLPTVSIEPIEMGRYREGFDTASDAAKARRRELVIESRLD